jgi:quercetin dioxygenase-like cupin family protein
MDNALEAPSPYEAVPIEFSYARGADALWQTSRRSGFQERDLKLKRASRGQMEAIELRAEGAGVLSSWPGVDEAVFMLLYVMAGNISFEMRDGETITLNPRDVVHIPFLLGTGKATYSDGLHLVEISARKPADGSELVPLLRMEPKAHDGPWEDAIVRNRKELFLRGDGPRAFFTYRDLGSARITDRRIHVHDGDGTEQELVEGTGWHNHSMSQFFFILGGAATIDVEHQGSFRVEPGDAMTLGKGMRHDVTNIAVGYNVIEVCLPADYSTTARTAPKSQDRING